ncbi:HNH endonuclease [Algibacter sp. L1A34]|uniref:HNH endonuclease n=1 Tax=Algibacter sp. L1A34 TaxID=2686365 RepID=UPI00131D9087|nr:HNH endonuclease [Algibacter sp. L1A34]
MRGISRLPEPQILIDRKITWRDNYIASGKKRPDSSKYAHNTVKTQLESMSFHKCFYCETKLKGKRKEVDHHIEVSVDKTLSYEWDNLYLSCDNCNGKIPHSTISIQDALDPCRHTDVTIKEHLTYENEFIQPRNNSVLGLRTIKKYRLDRELLDNRRLKQLNNFLQLFIEIRNAQQIEARNHLTEAELNAIYSFKRIDNSFSLMFELIIEHYGL